MNKLSGIALNLGGIENARYKEIEGRNERKTYYYVED